MGTLRQIWKSFTNCCAALHQTDERRANKSFVAIFSSFFCCYFSQRTPTLMTKQYTTKCDTHALVLINWHCFIFIELTTSALAMLLNWRISIDGNNGWVVLFSTISFICNWSLAIMDITLCHECSVYGLHFNGNCVETNGCLGAIGNDVFVFGPDVSPSISYFFRIYELRRVAGGSKPNQLRS